MSTCNESCPTYYRNCRTHRAPDCMFELQHTSTDTKHFRRASSRNGHQSQAHALALLESVRVLGSSDLMEGVHGQRQRASQLMLGQYPALPGRRLFRRGLCHLHNLLSKSACHGSSCASPIDVLILRLITPLLVLVFQLFASTGELLQLDPYLAPTLVQSLGTALKLWTLLLI